MFHVLHLCKKLSQKLAVLCRLRKVLSRNMVCHQYPLCIQPCIDFAISVLGSCSENNKYLISRLKHRAARIVTGNFDFINIRGADLLRELRWQSLDVRRDYYTSTLMYKCIYEAAPIRLINELRMTADLHSYPTRAATQDVHVPKRNNELYRQSFKYHSVILSNALPHDIKNAPILMNSNISTRNISLIKLCACTCNDCVHV